MVLNDFYSILAHLHDIHGIIMGDDEFENVALNGFYKIGNRRTAMYNVCGPTQNCEFEVPCNAIFIEMVTGDHEDFTRAENVYVNDYSNAVAEQTIESRVGDGGFFYQTGRMLHYEQHGTTLRFKRDYSNVNVLYKGEILDEEGLPQINNKELEAIALYCAYVAMNKRGMATRDQATLQIAQMLKQDWNRACANARTPEQLNQNEINEILQAKHSWDRKRYNVSFKPFRK